MFAYTAVSVWSLTVGVSWQLEVAELESVAAVAGIIASRANDPNAEPEAAPAGWEEANRQDVFIGECATVTAHALC